MHPKVASHSKFTFFIAIAWLGVFAISVGFGKTFIIPLVSGTKTWPVEIYAHGIIVFGWVLIFLIQSYLIQRGGYKAHKQIGMWSALVALGAAVSIIPAAMYQCERELKEGLGQTAISAIVGSLMSATMFLSLVSLGVIYRSKPEVHKRFMLLATILMIWPAWFRWRHYFPSVERPDIWFACVLANSLIIVAFIWDWLQNNRIHPVLLFGGIFIILESSTEILLFDSPGWRAVANVIYGLLN
jgi:uncharacterized membrane protein YozB (DUF420 family)